MSERLPHPMILTVYPISGQFKAKIINKVGNDLKIISVGDLRASGIFGFLKNIFLLNGNPLIIPLEDDASGALTPILKILAFFTRSKQMCLVNPDLQFNFFNRIEVVKEIFNLFKASLICVFLALVAAAELSFILVVRPKKPATDLALDSIVYLKTNLWFGLKAGGSVGHVAGVVNGFSRLGKRVTFVSIERPMMIDGDVVFLEVEHPKTFGLPYELNNYRLQKVFQKKLSKEKQLFKNSAIYQRLTIGNFLGAKLSLKYRVPLIVEYNGSEVWVSKNWGNGLRFSRLAQMAEDVMLQSADLVVTVSKVLKNELIGRGIDANKIVYYPNCIDPKIFNPKNFSKSEKIRLKEQYGIDRDAKLVTFVGTFGAWHGTEVLADAIGILVHKHRDLLIKQNVHFMFVGDGLKMSDTKKALTNADADCFVKFTGMIPQNEAPIHLAFSDILISPHVPNSDGTAFFGSPTKLYEYMAMGKPIIASDLDQIGEVLQPCLRSSSLPLKSPKPGSREVAILCEPSSRNDLVRAIEFLIIRDDWSQVLGNNASKMALSKYTWKNHVEKIIEGVI